MRHHSFVPFGGCGGRSTAPFDGYASHGTAAICACAPVGSSDHGHPRGQATSIRRLVGPRSWLAKACGK
ncbi:hypothetical protein HC891_12435 [Candidatus Gracilibacteria bacterium]|nr:hypothetical protein [Candidatus Gracilibacteria bacterium]